MIRFNGVATKYLDFYVNYYQNIKDKVDVFNQLFQIKLSKLLIEKNINNFGTIPLVK